MDLNGKINEIGKILANIQCDIAKIKLEVESLRNYNNRQEKSKWSALHKLK